MRGSTVKHAERLDIQIGDRDNGIILSTGLPLSSKAPCHSWAAPQTFPLLQRLDKTGVGLDACAFSFDEGMGSIERHSMISNEICNDYGCAS